MEIANLTSISKRCPAGTLPFYHSFGRHFACVPIETQGLGDAYTLGRFEVPYMCDQGRTPSRTTCIPVATPGAPGSLLPPGAVPSRPIPVPWQSRSLRGLDGSLGFTGGAFSLVKLALVFGAGFLVGRKL